MKKWMNGVRSSLKRLRAGENDAGAAGEAGSQLGAGRAGGYVPALQTEAQNPRYRGHEKGLEPLAKLLLEQQDNAPEEAAKTFINEQVATADEALKGARDIIAEWINENAELRDKLRKLFTHTAVLSSKVNEGKEAEGVKYKDYFDFKEELFSIPSHRVLAIFRGEAEGFLFASITPVEEEAMEIISKQFLNRP